MFPPLIHYSTECIRVVNFFILVPVFPYNKAGDGTKELQLFNALLLGQHVENFHGHNSV